MASLKGRLTGEVHILFENMKAFGISKRELKIKAISEGRPFYYHYNSKIFSLTTYESYKPKVKKFVHWCVDRFHIKHIGDIKHGMFREYISEKMGKVKSNTVKSHLAAIAKMGEGLGKSESFHRVSRQIQKQLPDDKVSRPCYESLDQALKILSEVERGNARYGLAMEVQLETACRVRELDKLRAEDLLGIVEQDGKQVGVVRLQGKGNLIREATVNEQTYYRLEEALKEKRTLINYDAYRAAIYRASEELGLRSGGTHKARRFSVRKLFVDGFNTLRGMGLSSQEAYENMLHEANRQLGHSPARNSTTRIYLNR